MPARARVHDNCHVETSCQLGPRLFYIYTKRLFHLATGSSGLRHRAKSDCWREITTCSSLVEMFHICAIKRPALYCVDSCFNRASTIVYASMRLLCCPREGRRNFSTNEICRHFFHVARTNNNNDNDNVSFLYIRSVSRWIKVTRQSPFTRLHAFGGGGAWIVFNSCKRNVFASAAVVSFIFRKIRFPALHVDYTSFAPAAQSLITHLLSFFEIPQTHFANEAHKATTAFPCAANLLFFT